MSRRYTSFLLRHWQLTADELRISVEHIQTGATTTVASLDAATRWLGEQVSALGAPALVPLAVEPTAEAAGDLTVGLTP